MVKIGINGFGRIGRLFLRASIAKGADKHTVDPGQEIVAINDPGMCAEQMAYLFKYDSVHGVFKGEVGTLGTSLTVDGKIIETYRAKKPEDIDWKNTCTEFVVESTGIFKNCDQAAGHLKSGVKRVFVTGPSNAPMFVVGVNHHCFTPDMPIISLASCTTNCLAPLAKVINDNFHIKYALMTTVHSLTGSQSVSDAVRGKNFRGGRAAGVNIIPKSTGAAKAIAKILPELKGKLTGMAFRVPVADVSAIDLTVKLKKPATPDLLKCRVKEAADGYLKGILGYTEHDAVSTDFISDPRSCIFDAKATLALNNCFYKLIAWYDNEYAYAMRVVDMIDYVHSVEEC